ncbi:MAG: secondary thiamine-phosphate synthase enzyme YjbQ [Janthinobacterium lividum]
MGRSLQRLTVHTRGQGLVEVTDRIVSWLDELAAGDGLLTVFCRHTSASLLVQENADPDVRADLEAFFARIAPESRTLYRHDSEGADDMPAHIRCALTQVQLSIPVADGRMVLGSWQGIYLFEHRRAAHRRELVLHFTAT